MKERKLLYAIGWVADGYLEEMMDPHMEKNTPSRKRVWLIAAVIAAMLLLAGCAAVVLLKLEDTALGEEILTDDMRGTRPVTQISLQGFAGSPSYLASKEWQEFLETYDPNNEILHSVAREDEYQGPEYYSYLCYTPEMARKVDEICAKYGLNTLDEPRHDQTWENVCRTLGVDDFLHEGDAMTVDREGMGGYIFRSGTFQLEFEVTLNGTDQPLFMDLRAVAKTDFDGVIGHLDQLDTYTQWTHTAPDGKELLLAYNATSALIFADRESCFITVTLRNRDLDWDGIGDQLCPDGGWMDADTWTKIADCFDFSFHLSPISDTDWEYLETHKKISNRPPLGYCPEIHSFDDQIRYIREANPNPERLQYALWDVDGNGREDLLIGRDNRVCYIYMIDGTDVYCRPFFKLTKMVPVKSTIYDEPQINLSPTYIEICEGNKVCFVYEYTDETFLYGIAEPSADFMDFTAIYGAEPENGVYTTIDPERFNSEPTTREAVEAALSALTPIEVELLPLSEYPLS